MEAIMGGNIVDKDFQKVDVADFSGDGKFVGIYFSAHWCPPCRGFTPVLADFYENVKGTGKFQVVFVSLDRDESSFKDYFGTMPWLAVDYSDQAKKDELSKKFGVSGIPQLVILNAKTGEVVEANARGTVTANQKSGKLPW